MVRLAGQNLILLFGLQRDFALTMSPLILDITVPFGKKCLVIFLGQVLLTMLYTAALRDTLFETLCSNSINWVLLGPTLLIQLLMASQMGKGFVADLVDW